MTPSPHARDPDRRTPDPGDEPAPRRSPDEYDLSQSTVLIVDDNAQNLELLYAYLEELGCSIATASDGIEALHVIEQHQPDLILLDVMMPRMSGFQVCTRVKSSPAMRDIPVVMVTALNEIGDVERAVEAGADDFLTKPVNKIELLTRVRSLLRVRLLRKDLDRALSQMRRLQQQRGADLDS